MQEQVQVRSLEAIGEFRSSLVTFAQTATSVLQQCDALVLRLVQWVQQDQLEYWQAEFRRSWDLVAQARRALEQCQQRYLEGQRPTCYQERKALEAAKRYTRHAEEKLRTVRRWGTQVQQIWTQYRGSTQDLRQLLEGEMPRYLQLLDRLLEQLEKYIQTAPPAPQLPPSVRTQADSAGTGTAAAWDAQVLEELWKQVPRGAQRKRIFQQQGVLPSLDALGQENQSDSPEAFPPWTNEAQTLCQQLELTAQVPQGRQFLVLIQHPLPVVMQAQVHWVALRTQGVLAQDSGWTVLSPQGPDRPQVLRLDRWPGLPGGLAWLGLPSGSACLVGPQGLLEVWDRQGKRLWRAQPPLPVHQPKESDHAQSSG